MKTADQEMLETSGVCLDSNIFVRLMATDETSDEAESFFETLMQNGYVLYAPSVLPFEVSQALGKKEKLKTMSSEVVDANIDRFYGFPILLEWNDSLLEGAMKIFRAGMNSLYDASFLAIAMKRKIPLVTEDQEIIKKGRKMYPYIYTMREYLRKVA